MEKLLTIADACVKATQGRFDPTALPLIRLWKSSLENGVIPKQSDQVAIGKRVNREFSVFLST
jgi:thiamine biosynthesis lipoprotein ApbE